MHVAFFAKSKWLMHGVGVLFVMCAALHVDAARSQVNIAPFNTFFWTRAGGSTTGMGYFGITSISDSSTQGGNLTYSALMELHNCAWWQQLFGNTSTNISIVLSTTKPDSIQMCDSRFENVAWLSQITNNATTTPYRVRFYFPILPAGQLYSRYDYFTILHNDTTYLNFYSVSDSVMIGSFVDSRSTGRRGTVFYAKNAVVLTTTDNNPLRIKNIRINGSAEPFMSAFLHFSLANLKSNADYYGIDISDTSINIDPIGISNISIDGAPSLIADTTYRIEWSLTNASEVAQCSLYVSFDAGTKWIAAGRTSDSATSFNWTAPRIDSSFCRIKVKALGASGQRSEAESSQFSITIPGVFVLSATPLSNNSIALEWDPAHLAHLLPSSLAVAYRQGSPAATWSSAVDNVTYDLQSSADTITGLASGFRYYFSLFVADSRGNYSLAPGYAIDSAFTGDKTPPQNAWLLTVAPLDQTTIQLTWSPGGQIDDVDSIAILYNNFHYPLSIADASSQHVDTYVPARREDTLAGLQSGETYFFALFAADSAGNWSDAPTNAQALVRPGASTGEAFTLLGSDTVSALSADVRLSSQPPLASPYQDTLDAWNGPQTKVGFIDIGPGFAFRNGNLSAPVKLSVSITYGTIPPAYLPTDLRVYRYNIHTGKWRIARDAPLINTTAGSLTISTSDISLPFKIMIDTTSPVVTAQLSGAAYFTTAERIVDTFEVTDNVENPQVRLLAGPGDRGYSDVSVYSAPGISAGTWTTSIPPYVADQCSGLRGLVIISDGRNADTVNVSRSIRRSNANCDDTLAPAQSWTPLFVTAQPDNPHLAAALSGNATTTDPFDYNRKNERIIQWLPAQFGNGEPVDWVEYSPDRDSLFSLAPGKLFWLKTKHNRTINYGNAVTPSLKDTFAIALNRGEWTDFSIPFAFSTYLGEILSATRALHGGDVDSLELYAWQKSGKQFRTEPIYLSGVAGRDNPLDIIPGASAYSVYNPLQKSIALRIPPSNTLTTSPAGLMGKKAADVAWSVRIGIQKSDNETLPPIYCASRPNNQPPRFYRMPPGFESINSGIHIAGSKQLFGHAASGDVSDGGEHFEIRSHNESNATQSVTYAIEELNNLPPDMQAALYARSASVKQMVQQEMRLTLQPHAQAANYLVVGNAEYLNSFDRFFFAKPTLLATTKHRFIKLAFSLPPDALSVRFLIFDLKGRLVRSKDLHRRSRSPTGVLMWNASIARGNYIVEMQIGGATQTQSHVLRQRLVYVY
ncbi:MAG: hypothetical protein GF398_04160 [Chitinivibrionales bacterium]|nr:hypothetical protein [Chitinivibrionales bacterium]